MTGRSRERRLAAARLAVSKVRNNQTVGLGSGDTAAIMVELLSERIRREELELTFVPSSFQIALKAEAHSLRTVPLGSAGRVDLTLDGCDEVDEELRLIKGGGGALANERVLANLSLRSVVVAEEEKLS
ncbi:MAG: ribose-5-phosphate isomerase A, partial [Candidatus Geothermarchaeales archaeon]